MRRAYTGLVKISELYAAGRPVFSFEFFPPRTDRGAKSLYETIGELAQLQPDFVSVTCPLDKERRSLTFELVARIKREMGIESMAHLVTVHYTRDEVADVLTGLRASGVENVLALRGDMPEDVEPSRVREFQHASDLASFAKPYGFSIGGAAHPEMHPDSVDWESELRGAVTKVEAGCAFLVTQLFFDNGDYYRYVERARAAGIDVPIVPGIMPVGSVGGIKRMAAMNGNRIPDALLTELERVADDAAAVHAMGVAWATAQCVDLLEHGVPGIHFYTLNQSPATRVILTALRAQLAI
jgi:methylenetetrahydrofolate reductase (NADPH)